MTQKLNQLQQAIREVCMELKELTFGCEVLHKSTNDVRHVVSDSVAGVCAGVCISTPRTGIVMYHHHFNELFEIIGHPIHLEHILRAVSGISQHLRYFSLSDKCISFEYIPTGYLVQIDFTLPLHLQSDDFINWLYRVLCE